MIYNLYSIYDEITEMYHIPFTAKNEGDAKRLFLAAATDEKTALFKNPNDFHCYYVGTYNDEDGTYLNEIPFKKIISGHQAKNIIKNENQQEIPK